MEKGAKAPLPIIVHLLIVLLTSCSPAEPASSSNQQLKLTIILSSFTNYFWPLYLNGKN